MNFLHYGSALRQADALRGVTKEHLNKALLLKVLDVPRFNSDLGVIVRGYGPKRTRKISVSSLQRDLGTTHILLDFFRQLGCRGFSHRIDRQIDMNEQLRSAIDLRLALMADDLFFYPPLVKKFLRRTENNHCFSNGFPSIAFALGERRADGFYIYVMQSDVVRATSAQVRQHFRGWRKILFAHILREAVDSTSNVYLCSAVDVLRTCRPEFPRPSQVPKSWIAIYDDTATFFNMELIEVSAPVNIQIYPDLPAVLTDRFFSARINKQKQGLNSKSLEWRNRMKDLDITQVFCEVLTGLGCLLVVLSIFILLGSHSMEDILAFAGAKLTIAGLGAILATAYIVGTMVDAIGLAVDSLCLERMIAKTSPSEEERKYFWKTVNEHVLAYREAQWTYYSCYRNLLILFAPGGVLWTIVIWKNVGPGWGVIAGAAFLGLEVSFFVTMRALVDIYYKITKYVGIVPQAPKNDQIID